MGSMSNEDMRACSWRRGWNDSGSENQPAVWRVVPQARGGKRGRVAGRA